MKESSSKLSTALKISPARIRYIKLGREGKWERECLTKNILRFGFSTQREDRFSFCRDRKWDRLTAAFLQADKSKGTATRFTNECRSFWEDDGKTLWIAFIGDRMYWAFLTSAPAERHSDGEGTYRKVAGEWRSSDLQGSPLMKSALAGNVTKLAAYRGTSCNV